MTSSIAVLLAYMEGCLLFKAESKNTDCHDMEDFALRSFG